MTRNLAFDKLPVGDAASVEGPSVTERTAAPNTSQVNQPFSRMARLLTAFGSDEMPMGGGIIMEQRRVSVDEWIARPQDGRRSIANRNRRDAMLQWMTVAMVAVVIMAVMMIFGGR
jgi:hypothetical protein